MAHHGWIPVLDPNSLTPSALQSPFGRLFAAADHSYNSHALSLLAGAHGPMEAPDKLVPQTTKSGIPTGFTFFGQFIDHDLTEFRVVGDGFRIVPANPTLGQRQKVLEDGEATATNGRRPTLDLDCVYGVLGVTDPDLFDADTGLFLLNSVEVADGAAPLPERDLLRDKRRYRNGRLIADPRNDENKLVVQIHLLFEQLHNMLHRAANGSAVEKRPGGTVFQATRTTVQNVYRRIVLHDYLPHIVQEEHIQAVLNALAAGTTFYQAMNKRATAAFDALLPEGHPDRGQPVIAMPVEFAHAAFRLGHSQLRAGYELNPTRSGANAVRLFGAAVDPRGDADLRGDRKLTHDLLVDWHFFFDNGVDGQAPRLGEPLDAVLPGALFRLPPPAIDAPPVSLAERNIRRGVDFGLPSGQEVAARLTEVYPGIRGLTTGELFPRPQFDHDFAEILDVEPRLAWATPLWYYILREAGTFTGGTQLGPVGGLIVAETILGSLTALGPAVFDVVAERARPKPVGGAGQPDDICTMAQLLTYLGHFP